MKHLFFLLFLFSTQLFFSQSKSSDFEVHQMLYYENENCQESMGLFKYTIIYQNQYEPGKFALYYLNSFSDEVIILYLANRFNLIYADYFNLAEFNAATMIEAYAGDMKDLNDVSKFKKTNVKHKFVEKENVLLNNRMLTAYTFKVKNADDLKEVVYYIDHASSGIPFSIHESFYEAMREEGFTLIGNVVQRDDTYRNGITCTHHLKSQQPPNKKISVIFDEDN